MAGPVLYTFGPIQFNLWPLNIHEFDHVTGTAYARKDVMQAIPQREWVGEDDETMQFQGRVFADSQIGGIAELEAFDACRKAGQAQLLIRNGLQAEVRGWYVIEKLRRHHTFINVEGLGRMVAFETTLSRCDSPDPTLQFQAINQLAT